MSCKGFCAKYMTSKLLHKNSGRYESGQKRCSFCEIYIIWDKIHCPCCGHVLRSKPRISRAKNKLAKIITYNS